ncbi:pyridoxamine 5'-phosphate oxidase, partial [Asbolus verrucosus]
MFREWLDEAKQYGAHSSLMNLATATKNGKVSNRTVVVRDITATGNLVFTAQVKSNKMKDIMENPQVAATFLLLYIKDGKNIGKQIRFVGMAEKLPMERCKIYYEKEKLSAKIRSWICQNSGPVDWNQLKFEHDHLLKEVIEDKKALEMPDTLVAYKIVPSEIDFYFSSGNQIADRILFKKGSNAEWKYERLRA